MTEIMFSSVKDAVRWSQETALLPDLQSSMRLLTSTGGSTINRHEAVDIAQTITNITAASKPYKGLILKAIYSNNREEDRTIGLIIASKINTDTEISKLVALCEGVVKNKRQEELFNNHYSYKKIAKDIGITREHFRKSDKWRDLHNQAKDRLSEYIEAGSRDVYQILNNMGWI